MGADSLGKSSRVCSILWERFRSSVETNKATTEAVDDVGCCRRRKRRRKIRAARYYRCFGILYMLLNTKDASEYCRRCSLPYMMSATVTLSPRKVDKLIVCYHETTAAANMFKLTQINPRVLTLSPLLVRPNSAIRLSKKQKPTTESVTGMKLVMKYIV